MIIQYIKLRISQWSYLCPQMASSASDDTTLKDIIATIELTKLNAADLSETVQVLEFAEDASDTSVFLIQLDKDILEEESLVIRGEETDSAVLCSEDSTYDLKKAGTSNTLLMLDDCIIPSSNCVENGSFNVVHNKIVNWSNSYLELKKTYPHIRRIQKLLQENPYKGEENENSEKRKYTLSDLFKLIQASESEIMNSLLKIGSCCIDGYWRLLDFSYVVDCLGEIFNVIDSESWNFKQVPLQTLCEKINDSGELVPEYIVHHLMAYYGSRASDTGNLNEVIFILSEEKVCKFFAEMLLRDVGKFNLSDFLEVWKQSVPEGMVPNESYLKGLALIDHANRPSTIQYFECSALPQSPEERFEILFKKREKWLKDDISPYLKDLCVNGQTESALVMKYARSSTYNGCKVFSSRKSVK